MTSIYTQKPKNGNSAAVLSLHSKSLLQSRTFREVTQSMFMYVNTSAHSSSLCRAAYQSCTVAMRICVLHTVSAFATEVARKIVRQFT
jgi:hypothetical protein